MFTIWIAAYCGTASGDFFPKETSFFVWISLCRLTITYYTTHSIWIFFSPYYHNTQHKSAQCPMPYYSKSFKQIELASFFKSVTISTVKNYVLENSWLDPCLFPMSPISEVDQWWIMCIASCKQVSFSLVVAKYIQQNPIRIHHIEHWTQN